MANSLRKRQVSGFGLIEVMISVVVIAIGLLGIAKLNALSIGNSRVSGSRSLASIYMGSLTAAMHANGAYWRTTGVVSTGTILVNGTTLSGDSALAAVAAPAPCAYSASTPSPSCDATTLAAYDLQTWGTSLTQLPSGFGKVTCAATTPVSCTIIVSWGEKYIANNAASATGTATQNATQTLTSLVVP